MLSFADFFDEKKSYAATLIKLAQLDGKIVVSENMWLNFVTVSMGIQPNILEDIHNNLEKFSFMAPETEEERFFMFFRLIQLMKVDLNIDEKEVNYCREMGLHLIILPSKIEAVLNLAKANEVKLITYEEVEALLKS